jgi:lactoylglutathione lyase
MRVGYVVLYVNDAEACRNFWTEKVGMIEKGRQQAGEFSVIEVGFADQQFSLELVPLALMANNPDGLDLATPSIAFRVDDLVATHAKLIAAGVQAMEPGDHGGTPSFPFSDNEGRWFAVTEVK